MAPPRSPTRSPPPTSTCSTGCPTRPSSPSGATRRRSLTEAAQDLADVAEGVGTAQAGGVVEVEPVADQLDRAGQGGVAEMVVQHAEPGVADVGQGRAGAVVVLLGDARGRDERAVEVAAGVHRGLEVER